MPFHQVDIGLSLFPGHFTLEVSDEQLRLNTKNSYDVDKQKSFKNNKAKLNEAYHK